MVLVSAVQKAWSEKVFSVGTGGLYVETSCHRFITFFFHIESHFSYIHVFIKCRPVLSGIFYRSSGIPAHLPKGGYDPKEASRHMAEEQNIRIRSAVCKRRSWVEV